MRLGQVKKKKGTSLGRIACSPKGAIAQEVEPKAKILRVLLRQLGAKGLWPISPQAWLQVCGVSEQAAVQGFEFYSAEEIRGTSTPSGFLQELRRGSGPIIPSWASSSRPPSS